MFSYIKIEDFCNLKNFEMEFESKKNTKSNINLNMLIGKNGSGKSCLLDALFEIALNNLKNKKSEEDATSFNYQIKINVDNSQNILCSKPKANTNELVKNLEDYLWDKVFRFYTGSTRRNNTDFSRNIIDLNETDVKWILPSIFLTSYWNIHEDNEDYNIWMKILKLSSDCNLNDNCNAMINPKVVWLKLKNKDKLKELTEKLKIKSPDYKFNENETLKCFWNIDKDLSKNLGNKPLNVLYELKEDEDFLDAGFLYEKSNKIGEYYTEQSLSDGELGVFNRLALLMILRIENKKVENKEKYLILLDEPETHFNENWKTQIINLIEEIFSEYSIKHDIFIATHSAMLITDTKKEELHRLYNTKNGGIKATTLSFNTYGANIVDIGKTLFQMESDIGERSKKDIEKALHNNDKIELKKLLKQVGPGEWRWKIRSKINQLEKQDCCCNFSQKKKVSSDATT